MSRPSKHWLITDTHFNHVAVVERMGRPRNHGERIIKACKHLIQPQDVLIHLGDVIFDRPTELKGLLDQIECRSKILTLGNHDRKSNNWYLNNGFDLVVEMLVIGDVLLSHKPQEFFPAGVRVNVHGHFHNTNHRKNEPQFQKFLGPQHVLLAMETVGYTPVELVRFAK